MPRDVYLQPNLPDPVLEPSVVLDLARWFEPNAQAITAVDETGGEARTYVIDDGIVFKTQRPHRLRPRTSLSKEVLFLKHIEQHAPARHREIDLAADVLEDSIDLVVCRTAVMVGGAPAPEHEATQPPKEAGGK